MSAVTCCTPHLPTGRARRVAGTACAHSRAGAGKKKAAGSNLYQQTPPPYWPNVGKSISYPSSYTADFPTFGSCSGGEATQPAAPAVLQRAQVFVGQSQQRF